MSLGEKKEDKEERRKKKKKMKMSEKSKKKKKKRMFWLNLDGLSLSKFVCEFAKFASHRDFILTSSFSSLSFSFSLSITFTFSLTLSISLFFLARLVCVLCYTFIAQPSLWMSKIRERIKTKRGIKSEQFLTGGYCVYILY